MGWERMRTAIKVFFLALAILVVVLIVATVYELRPLQFKMADGSVIRVERIIFGKYEHFKPEKGWFRNLKDRALQELPKKWASRFIKKPTILAGGMTWSFGPTASSDALQIWMSRSDPNSGQYRAMSVNVALVDEHRCEFGPGAVRIENSIFAAGSTITCFGFDAFPRNERKIKLRLYGEQNKVLTEFRVSNPAPPVTAGQWAVESLPITKRDGDVSFVLTGVNLITNHFDHKRVFLGFAQQVGIEPRFDFLERDGPSKEWQMVDMELYDCSGNVASRYTQSRFLCPLEKAWKLDVKFCGSEQSPSASNAVWTIRGVKVPGQDEFASLETASGKGSDTLGGIKFKAIALAGPGEIHYSHNSPVEAIPGADTKEYNDPIMFSTGGDSFKVRSNRRYIAFQAGMVAEDQRLTVRAVDDQGRQYYGYDSRNATPPEPPNNINYISHRFSGQEFLVLDLTQDAKTVDLTFCVHNARTAEFIFKPPMPEKH